MGISDQIAEFISNMLRDANGVAELSRSLLAEQFQCAPSQINYVLSTRFSPEHGFIIQSRRGGGGYIRVTRVRLERACLIMHAVNAVGGGIDARAASAFLENMLAGSAIDAGQALMIAAAISPGALSAVPPPYRDSVRAAVLKQCLLECINKKSDRNVESKMIKEEIKILKEEQLFQPLAQIVHALIKNEPESAHQLEIKLQSTPCIPKLTELIEKHGGRFTILGILTAVCDELERNYFCETTDVFCPICNQSETGYYTLIRGEASPQQKSSEVS